MHGWAKGGGQGGCLRLGGHIRDVYDEKGRGRKFEEEDHNEQERLD